MPYLTYFVEPKQEQLTVDDILLQTNRAKMFQAQPKDTRDTRTIYTEKLNERLCNLTNFNRMIDTLKEFNQKYANLISVTDKQNLYYTFYIPKRTGGLRQIDAPNQELSLALRELKNIFESKLYAIYHTSAFAYIKGRNTIDLVKRHQRNNSRWFLKVDFSKFFPSSTPDFIISQLNQIYPYCEIMKIEDGKSALEKALSLCFLNNGLPQGTPISPLLSNLMMVPLDHDINKMCRENSPHLIYTRYADDIYISSEYTFDQYKIENKLIQSLKKFSAPFALNPEKTKYGSYAGRNYILSVVLNNENKISIGSEKKKQFKAMIFNFMKDYTNGVKWELHDVQVLNGLISYYKMVEGEESIGRIIYSYTTKFNLSVMDAMKEILKS